MKMKKKEKKKRGRRILTGGPQLLKMCITSVGGERSAVIRQMDRSSSSAISNISHTHLE